MSISAQSGNGQLAFVGFLRISKDHRTRTRSHHNDIDRDAVAGSVDDSKRVDTRRGLQQHGVDIEVRRHLARNGYLAGRFAAGLTNPCNDVGLQRIGRGLK